MAGKHEWQILKNHGCFVCGRKEPAVTLDETHLKAKERGGKVVVAMCLEHHRKYDAGDHAVLRKLGVTAEVHRRYLAPRRKAGESGRGALIHKVPDLID